MNTRRYIGSGYWYLVGKGYFTDSPRGLVAMPVYGNRGLRVAIADDLWSRYGKSFSVPAHP